MSEPQDTKDVASQYWGQGPPRQTDIHGLGPPPRALTIGMEEYVQKKHSAGWIGWVVFAALFFGIPPAAVATESWVGALVVAVVAIGIGVWLKQVVEGKRKKLRWFLEHAALVNATIQHVHSVITRAKSPLARAAVGDHGTYTLTLAVDGVAGTIRCVTHDTGLGNLIAPGQRIEVLVHPQMPHTVITTAELPSS